MMFDLLKLQNSALHRSKAYDTYYPMMPRDDNYKDPLKDKYKYNDKDEMTKKPNMYHIFGK